jgi:hypothetical protein
LTILNDDAQPSVAFAGAPYSVVENAGPATVVLTLTNASAFTLTVDLATSDGTALAASDYVPQSVVLTFAPGITSVTTSIGITDDVLYEGNETFNVTLSNPVSATVAAPGSTVVTIVDDETQPTVQFSASAYNVVEDNGPAVITVTLSGSSAFTVTVTVTSTNGTAIAPADYAAVTTVVTFTPGTTQQTFNVTIVPDVLDELDETLLLMLSNANNATITGTNPVVLTILDDDATPTLSIGNVTQNEGNVGTTNFVFTVTLSAASELTVTVDFTTGDDTALAGSDYAATSGTVTFLPGATTQFVTVTVNGDTTFELNETFFVTLTNPVNATVAVTQAVGTIVNDDALPTVQFNTTQYSVIEDLGPATITVTLSNPSAFTITVSYTSTDGTAIAGVDYTAASGVVTFAPGATQQTYTVAILTDPIDEADETVLLGLSSPVSATLGVTNAATLTIVDDDPTPSVSFSVPTFFTNELTTTVPIFVELSNPSAFTVTVNYSTTNGTATAGLDYLGTSGTLTFTPGVTQQTFIVSILHDVINEPDETVILTLSSPVSATVVAPNPATLIIVDNDGTPRVNFESAAFNVDENAGPAVITVTLTNPSAFTITVNYNTTDNTATSPADYTPTSGVLTFAPGITELTFGVPIVSDNFHEANETITLTLSNPISGLLGLVPTATLTIIDDDAEPMVVLSSAAYSVAETAGSVVVTATLSGQSAFTVTVVLTTTDATATAGSDYTAVNTTLTFAPGITTVTQAITINDDVVYEGNETFNVGLSAPTNTTLGATPAAIVTIVDDEVQPTLQLSSAAYSVNENAGPALVTATLSNPSAFTVTVVLTTTDATATAGSDYTAVNTTLTFAPGITTVTQAVTINDDVVYEGSETFNVGLSSPTNTTLGATAAAVVTIVDNEVQPTVQLSSATYSVAETAGSVVVTVSLSNPSVFTVTVTITTSNGTATAGSDYNAVNTTLTFAPGITTVTQAVTINDDVLYEGNETFNVGLSAPTNTTLGGTPAAVVTIVENEGVPTVALSAGGYSVNENAGPVVVTVTLSGQSAFTVTVVLTTTDATATAGSDYTAVNTTLTFAPGITTVTQALTINDDVVFEGDENFTVGLSAPSNATLGGTAAAVVTILENEAGPKVALSASAYSVSETAGSVVVTATLDVQSAVTVTVVLTTSNGSAVSPADYGAVGTTLTFAPGITLVTQAITIVNDAIYETNETFNVGLSNVTLATLNTPSSAVVTIVDDDAQPTVSLSSATYSVAENAGPVVVTATLSNPSAFTVTVVLTTSNGSASSVTDYTAVNTTLTFAPLQTVATQAITINDDVLYEGNETFNVGLSAPTNTTLGATPAAIVTIVDNETQPTVSLSSAAYSVAENGGAVIVTATLSGPSAFTVTVVITSSNNIASSASDYAALNTTLTFAPSITTVTTSIVITDDVLYEGNETFNVGLSSPTNATLGATPAAIVTIVENEVVPTMQLSSVTYSVNENAGPAIVTATLNYPSVFTVTVVLTTSNLTASSASDYAPQNVTLTFAPLQTVVTSSIAITDDAVFEGNETFNVGLSGAVNATLGATPAAVVTILENEAGPSVSLSASAYSVTENAGPAIVTATLSVPSSVTVTVVITTNNGTATSPADYGTVNTTLTFAPLQTVVTQTISIVNDTVFEGNETFNLALSNATLATIGIPSSAVVTIVEDEPQPSIQLTSATVSVNENAGPVVVTATLSNPSAFTVTVTITTSNGTASSVTDYTAVNTTLTFAPLQTIATQNITINDDAVYETAETFNVALSNANNATLGATSTAVVTITDNETQPTVQLSSVTYSVNENAGPAIITVTLSNASAFTVTVVITTSNNTAASPADYGAVSTTLTFAPLQTVATQAVTINDDVVYEGNETFNVALSNANNAMLGATPAAVVTIVENEALPTVQFSASAYSVNESAATATITVTLNYPSVFTVTVNYATSDGSVSGANAGSDYVGVTSVVTFTPGLTTQTFTVAIINDTLDEANETVNLTLSTPTSATLGVPNPATLTITDDDPTPSLVIADVTRNEGSSGTTNFVFTVTLSAPSGLTVTVNYNTANGTATAPSDYAASASVVTFTPGTTTQFITIAVVGDTTYEVTETFTVTLSGASSATISDPQGVGTILNDDTNLAPIANAGPDQTVFVSTLVTLDGSASTDTDGHLPLAYRWTQTSGTPIVLSSNIISRPTFTAPTLPTVLTFQLIVTDTVGAPSAADTVVVTVTDRAIAGLSLTAVLPITATKPTTFTASITAGTNVTYIWKFGDSTPIILDGNIITHTYATPGVYTVIVTATNSVGSVTKTLVIMVNPAIIVFPPGFFKVYLPIIMQPASGPDLVGSFSLSPNKSNFVAGEPVTIFVTVTNQGNAAAAPFWVDFYINPSPVPTTSNLIWNNACGLTPCFGLAWYVSGGLAAGQSIVLTSQPGQFAASYSTWPGWFAVGTSDLYLYVDTWNPTVPTAAVAETSETNNRSERHGLIVTGTNPAFRLPDLDTIPTRPTPR